MLIKIKPVSELLDTKYTLAMEAALPADRIVEVSGIYTEDMIAEVYDVPVGTLVGYSNHTFEQAKQRAYEKYDLAILTDIKLQDVSPFKFGGQHSAKHIFPVEV